MKRQARGLVEAIQFVVIGGIRAQIRVALLDNHVASGTGAASSAGMLDLHTEIDSDI
jgi:hypothetical protein